jgi:hypothetical protein
VANPGGDGGGRGGANQTGVFLNSLKKGIILAVYQADTVKLGSHETQYICIRSNSIIEKYTLLNTNNNVLRHALKLPVKTLMNCIEFQPL